MTLCSHLVLVSQLDYIEGVVGAVPGEAAGHGPLVPVIQQLTLKSNHLAFLDEGVGRGLHQV